MTDVRGRVKNCNIYFLRASLFSNTTVRVAMIFKFLLSAWTNPLAWAK